MMGDVKMVYNKEKGVWEEYKEPYAVIEVQTKEEFNKLNEMLELGRKEYEKIHNEGGNN